MNSTGVIKIKTERLMNLAGSALGASLIVLFICNSAFADSLLLSTVPANGNISGPAGSAIGWGYSITNQSSSDWLVTTDLTADPFLHGTPSLLFDFPIIGPNQTVTASFNPATAAGLYELMWDSGAPAGFLNSGIFVLSAQWWDGDPTNGGNFIADAPDTSVAYSATVNSVPEPTTLTLLFASSLFAIARRFRLIPHERNPKRRGS